jgi:hypothetical protein
MYASHFVAEHHREWTGKDALDYMEVGTTDPARGDIDHLDVGTRLRLGVVDYVLERPIDLGGDDCTHSYSCPGASEPKYAART